MWCLVGNVENWDGVGGGGVEVGDYVGVGRVGGVDVDVDVVGFGMGVVFGYVWGVFDVMG